MKKAHTQTDFASDKINILVCDVQVIFSSFGHYCIPTSRVNINNISVNKELKEVISFYCKELDVKSSEQKHKLAEKLHRQFSHARSERLKSLLHDADMSDRELDAILEKLDDSCSICKKYRVPVLKRMFILSEKMVPISG